MYLICVDRLSLYNRIVIRIRCDAKNTSVILGLKFGSEPDEETINLIKLAKHLGLNLHGFSFHVGSPCGEMEAYRRGIELCKQLINISKAIGHDNVQLIDIGGGFPGENGTNVDMVYIYIYIFREIFSNFFPKSFGPFHNIIFFILKRSLLN